MKAALIHVIWEPARARLRVLAQKVNVHRRMCVHEVVTQPKVQNMARGPVYTHMGQ